LPFSFFPIKIQTCDLETNQFPCDERFSMSLSNQPRFHAPPGLPSPKHEPFQTDLYLPGYPDGIWGRWEIRTSGMNMDHGYYTGAWLVQDMPVLLKHAPDGKTPPESWMAVCPHEIESQELGCRNAFGHTVVMGLGLGWFALNAALNPKVGKVSVVERDPDIIELFFATGILERAPKEAKKKISVLKGDALEWNPPADRPVDFLYADIWKHLAEACVLDQVNAMQANIRAGQIYFWGQEMVIYNRAKTQWPDLEELDDHTLRRCIKELIGLPLLIPQDRDYATMINQVIRNRTARRLPLKNP
jgi:hypothetical protein